VPLRNTEEEERRLKRLRTFTEELVNYVTAILVELCIFLDKIAENMIGTSVAIIKTFTSRSELLPADQAPNYSAAADYHCWQYVDCGQGTVDPLLLLVTLTGGTFAAAAQTLNCIYDRDIDYEWSAHAIDLCRLDGCSRDALLFAIALGTLSFTVLAVGANLLSALLAMSGIVFYMLVYTG